MKINFSIDPKLTDNAWFDPTFGGFDDALVRTGTGSGQPGFIILVCAPIDPVPWWM